MTRSFSWLTFVALSTFGTMASAELTPQDVWQHLQRAAVGSGYTVTGTERVDGGQLTVDDITLVSAPNPIDQSFVTIDYGTLTFTEGTGEVVIGIPSTDPVAFRTDIDGVGVVAGEVLQTLSGLDLRASGTPEDITFTYSADAMSYTMEGITFDGRPVAEADTRFAISLADMSGTSRTAVGTDRASTLTLRAAAAAYEFYTAAPGLGSGGQELVFNVDDLAVDSQSSLPLDITPEEAVNLATSGVTIDLRAAHGGGALRVTTTQEEGSIAYQGRSDGANVTVTLDDGAFDYAIATMGSEIQLFVSNLGVPMTLEAGDTEFGFAMPMTKTDDFAPFGFGLALRGFDMSETIWGLFDPGRALPRDPGTLEIDISGAMRWLVDLVALQQNPELAEDAPPAEVNQVTLNTFILDMVGARLSGTGDVNIDLTQPGPVPGMPAAEGLLSLQLTGANALIDSLLNTGLLRPEQAIGARMMMSAFARPAGDDAFVSEIELRPNGQVLANGQRIR